MISNGFVYAMDIYEMKKKKAEEKLEPLKNSFYAICKKYDCSLPELEKEKITKKEYQIILKYIDKVLKYPLKLYPNLQ